MYLDLKFEEINIFLTVTYCVFAYVIARDNRLFLEVSQLGIVIPYL